ncbi:MAG: adenylate/guanylate cyclase domain-containing protein [bacterium]
MMERKKKILFIIISSALCLVATMSAHYWDMPMCVWTSPLVAVPVVYAGIHFRRAGSAATAFILLVAQVPVILIYASRHLEGGTKYFTSIVTALIVAIYVGHRQRKSRDNSRHLNKIHDTVRRIQQNIEPKLLLSELEEQFKEIGSADSVEICLLDQEGILREYKSGEEVSPDDHAYYKILKNRNFVVSANVPNDARFEYIGGMEKNDAAEQFAIFPIEYGGAARGVISIIESRDGRLGKEEITFLNAYKKAIENALEVVEKREDKIKHELQKKRIRDTFSSYVSRSVAEEILKDPDKLELGGKSQIVTVMFTEIVNFKALQKTVEPSLLFDSLNEYFAAAIDTIFEYDGTLDKFIGDNVMAFWGAPIPMPDSELRAVQCALSLNRKVSELNSRWRQEGREEFIFSIGINSGEVVAGNIGSIRRMEYTIIGDTVNTASRIKSISISKSIPILVGETTFQKVKDRVQIVERYDATVKGKAEAISVYQLSV